MRSLALSMRLRLHLEATERHDALGRETEVAHHRNLRVEQRAHDSLTNPAAFEFHAVGSASNQLGGVSHALTEVDVVAQPRHVRDDVRVGLGRRHRANVVTHVVDTEVQGVLLTEYDVGQRVTDEDQIDAGR